MADPIQNNFDADTPDGKEATRRAFRLAQERQIMGEASWATTADTPEALVKELGFMLAGALEAVAALVDDAARREGCTPDDMYDRILSTLHWRDR